MNQLNSNNESVQIQKLVARYNMIANLFWSGIHLTPVVVFCSTRLPSKFLYPFIITSLSTLLIPASFFNNLSCKTGKPAYRKMGIRFINRFTQNGAIINKLVRRRYPSYKVIKPGKNSVQAVWHQTFLFEKFHFMFLLFFILTSGYALLKGYGGWFLVLSFNNLVYNVYPIFLQHYIRSRMRSATGVNPNSPGGLRK